MLEDGNRLELGERIGHGGFGVVYRGTMRGRRGFEKQVAVKVVRRGSGERMAERLRDEARMLALVRHRAVVHVDDLVQLDGDWALVMEWIDGADLDALIDLGPVPLGPAAEIVAELAGALRSAFHATGPDGRALRLVHRDVKPANVLVTAEGATKLLDFGIAKATFQEREAHTMDTGYGSLGYLSPERLDGVEDPRGDVYSLGVIAYELLTGQAFGRTSAREDRHEQRLAQALAGLGSTGAPLEVCELVYRMLAHDPAERPGLDEVERAFIATRGSAGLSLRDWAEKAVPLAQSSRNESGERNPTERFTAPVPKPAPPVAEPRRAGVAVVLAAAASLAVVALAVALSVAPHVGRAAPDVGQASLPAQNVAPASPPAQTVAPASPPVVEPLPEAPPAEPPAVVEPAPAPPPPVARARKPEPEPEPVVVAVAPPPVASSEPREVHVDRVVARFESQQRAMVTVESSAPVRLVAGTSEWPVPGAVPAGEYDVVQGGAVRGSVRIGPGEIVEVTCDTSGCRR